jgi:hypothetical protein
MKSELIREIKAIGRRIAMTDDIEELVRLYRQANAAFARLNRLGALTPKTAA